MNVLFVSSELTPFAKTGGLADVSAALSRYLHRQEHDVRPFLPMYRRVREGPWRFSPHPELQDLSLRMGSHDFTFSISTAPLPGGGPDVWFVRCPALYDRPGIYCDDGDEHLRFGLLQRAALLCCQHLGWSPAVAHCNDWHTGLIPLYLKRFMSWDELFRDTKSVLTIHNIAYQGAFPADRLGDIELEEARELLHQDDLSEGAFSFLKTGLLYADAITTVSETYAREIRTPELGMGLEGLLEARSDSLFGIVNGVDYDVWNPASDPLIPAHFTPEDLSGKETCKRALLERSGLPYAEGVPVIGIVSRLTAQKGFELLPDILPVFLQRQDMRFVVLGSGDERMERYFHWLGQTFPTRAAYHTGYDEELAHWIEAGSDMFLMPSRFEPCGLNQMYSMKYGTVPIVRATGGLADTVAPYDSAGGGTGFVFGDFDSEALFQAIARALEAWPDRDAWTALMRRGMAQDWSWDSQGRHYVDLYRHLAG